MDIRLNSLRMENFKCHKALTIDFQGRNASIYGDNGTGKTSIYDALTWLLFGKSSGGDGEKNFEVKPTGSDGGVIDHQAVTEVEAVLAVDGQKKTLKRTYRELWTTKRGSSEASYDGNTSEYYIDGVPCKAVSFKAAVAELVDEERFKLLTSVSYFAGTMAWQKRREILFDLFGMQDDRQIMETDSRFTPLLDAMGSHSLEDYRKIVQQERKGYMTTRNEVPARISECEKTIRDLAALDFAGAEAQLEILRQRYRSLNEELLAIEQNTAVQSKELELQRAKLALDRLEDDNHKFRAGQKVASPTASILEGEQRQKGNILVSVKRSLEMRQRDIAACESRIEAAREKWKAINAEQFTGSQCCPTCGQILPADQIQKSRAAFEVSKADRMEQAVKDANRCKDDKAQYETELAENQSYIAELEAEITALDGKIQAAKAATLNVEIQDKPGYLVEKMEIESSIKTINQELRQLRDDSASAASGLRMRMLEIQQESNRVAGIAGKRSAYEYAQGRIDQLRADAQEAAEKLNGLDKMLWLMEEFSRYKASFAENGMNERFRLAKFRLFREQANGGLEERCDVVYNGIPYNGNLNNGMKINVGIDIINTLSRAYGVTVPLFVDNAESVTELEKTDCQLIRLVVSENDKELRINYGEN